MDTSEQYIKMCACPLIQDQWIIASKKSPNAILWANSPSSKYNRIWLPFQDQIQEMVRKDYENTLDMLCNFYAVITVDQPTGFQQMFEVSMEQLWLVFYMYEKHKKIWDGKKWIKK